MNGLLNGLPIYTNTIKGIVSIISHKYRLFCLGCSTNYCCDKPAGSLLGMVCGTVCICTQIKAILFLPT